MRANPTRYDVALPYAIVSELIFINSLKGTQYVHQTIPKWKTNNDNKDISSMPRNKRIHETESISFAMRAVLPFELDIFCVHRLTRRTEYMKIGVRQLVRSPAFQCQHYFCWAIVCVCCNVFLNDFGHTEILAVRFRRRGSFHRSPIFLKFIRVFLSQRNGVHYNCIESNDCDRNRICLDPHAI